MEVVGIDPRNIRKIPENKIYAFGMIMHELNAKYAFSLKYIKTTFLGISDDSEHFFGTWENVT